MDTDVIILGARPYDFEDKQTKKQITGVSVHVLPLDAGDADVNGLIPVKYSLTNEQYKALSFTTLPARAVLTLSYNLSSKRVSFSKFSEIEAIVLG